MFEIQRKGFYVFELVIVLIVTSLIITASFTAYEKLYLPSKAHMEAEKVKQSVKNNNQKEVKEVKEVKEEGFDLFSNLFIILVLGWLIFFIAKPSRNTEDISSQEELFPEIINTEADPPIVSIENPIIQEKENINTLKNLKRGRRKIHV